MSNGLKEVKAPSTSTSKSNTGVKDVGIVIEMDAALKVHPHCNDFRTVFTSLEGSTIVLQGTVTTFYLKQLAQEALKQFVDSEGSIDNRIQVPEKK